jgi:hypothetical protein
VMAIASGFYHSLALKSDGTVWAWGNNFDGELGNGTTTTTGCECIETPVQVIFAPGVTITAIAGGGFHSLALDSNGVVWAWGYGGDGQLGNGTMGVGGVTSDDSSVPVPSAMTNATAIAGGYFHSVALKSDGTVWTWGYNSSGELGNGTTVNSSIPVQVSGLTGVTAIAAGRGELGDHSLALKSDGTVWAWGNNDWGQLGDGLDFGHNSSVPVQVSGLTGVTAIAAGGHHSMALKSDATAWAWGENEFGQLGDGSATERDTPVQVSSLTGVIAIAGADNHSLALASPPPAQLLSVVSELTHGSAGPFDIDLPLTGTRGVECRSSASLGEGNYTLVFSFANSLTSVESVSASATGPIQPGPSTGSIDSNDPHNYIVNLTGLPNAQYITITLTNVTDSLGEFSSAVSATMGVLIGDVNGDGQVDSSDLILVKQQTLQTVNDNPGTSNFREDVNADGSIDSSDLIITKRQTLTGLPALP